MISLYCADLKSGAILFAVNSNPISCDRGEEKVKIPKKVIIEITGERYSTKALDMDGHILWQDSHKMESRGESELESGNDIYESELDEYFPELCDAINDLSFGPFGVACALYSIDELEQQP